MEFRDGIKNPELVRFMSKNFNAITPVEAVKASKTYGATTSVITLTADKYGTVGNNFTMAIVSASEDGSLALSFNPQTQTLVVTPARSTGADTTTGAQLATAINADSIISEYVTASAGGAGIMAETASAVNLNGGVDGAEGIGGFSQMLSSNGLTMYTCNSNATVNDTGKWSKVTMTVA